MTTALLITGRSLANYRARGATVQPGFTVEPCLGCGQQIALSPEAASKLAHARAAGWSPAGALCTLCSLMVTPPGAEIHATKFGADLIENDEGARAFVSALQKKAGTP